MTTRLHWGEKAESVFGEKTGMEKLGWWPMEGFEVFGGSGGTKLPFDKGWLGGQ